MPAEPLSLDDSLSETEQDTGAERLSQNGQILGIAIYGGLVLVGFFFGIVTGYEKTKPPIVVVKKDTVTPKPETPTAPKVETPQPTPKINPTPSPEPKKVDPPPEPKKDDSPVAPEPKIVTPPSPEPKKVEPSTPTVVISYEKHVMPIFRRYCFNCHGAVGKPKGDVDLTSLAKIIDPDNPPILKAGDPKKSAIYTTIEDLAMPPEGARPGKQELDIIREWILGGAKPRRRKLNRTRGRQSRQA